MFRNCRYIDFNISLVEYDIVNVFTGKVHVENHANLEKIYINIISFVIIIIKYNTIITVCYIGVC